MSYYSIYARYTQVAGEPNEADEVAFICPFHDDNRPSGSFNVETGLWFCFACNRGGSAASFIAAVRGCSVEEAKAEIRDAFQNELDVDAWHEALWKSSAALGWLSSRKLLDRDVLKDLKIGWDGNRITIPVYDTEGNLCNVRRRSVKESGEAKVVNFPGCGSPPRLWPVQNLRGEGPVWVVEGETDCLAAICQGLRAVTSTGGANTWLEDWGELFKGQNVIVAYDADAAGKEGSRKVISALREYAASIKVAVLPEGKDLNDLHLEGFIFNDLTLRDTEQFGDDVEDVLQSLPEEIDVKERFHWLQKVAERIAEKSQDRREYYIEIARKRLNVSAKVLRDAVARVVEARIAPAEVPRALQEPLRPDANYAQDYDFERGVLRYGVWLPTSDGSFTFRMITSSRQMEIPPDDAPKPAPTFRWSVDNRTPYNVFAWLRNDTEPVDPKTLYEELAQVFAEFMWFPNEDAPYVLAAWIMASYVFMVFDTCGYLLVTGTKQSGKSRLLEIIEALAFNAAKSGTLSAAMLFRTVEVDRSVMLFDESDILAKNTDQVTDRLAVVLDGYRRSGKAGRVEGDSHQPRWFSTYSPKAFASVYTLPDTVIDRSIIITTLRKTPDAKISTLVFGQQQRRFQILRNKLYCWGLEAAGRMAELQGEVTETSTGIKDREYEVWRSLLCVGALVGDLERLAQAAKVSTSLKVSGEQELSITSAVIQACAFLLYEDPDHTDPDGSRWYLRSRVREGVAKILDCTAEDITPHRIASELVKTGIVRQGMSRQFRHAGLRGKRAYQLDPVLVMGACQRFNVMADIGREQMG